MPPRTPSQLQTDNNQYGPSFWHTRYPLDRLQELRALLKKLRDIADNNPTSLEICNNSIIKALTQEDALITALMTEESWDLTVGKDKLLMQLQQRHRNLTTLFEILESYDRRYDTADQSIPTVPKDPFLKWRQRVFGNGLAGWFGVRRTVAAWLPGEYSLPELWQLARERFWQLGWVQLFTQPTDKKSPTQPTSSMDPHHPWHTRTILIQGGCKEHAEEASAANTPLNLTEFNQKIRLLISSYKQTLIEMETLAQRLDASTEAQYNDLKKELSHKRNRYQQQKALLEAIERSAFPHFRQRLSDASHDFFLLFISAGLFGITLIALTLLAKFGVLGVLAAKFSQLPIVSHGLNYLVNFLNNVHAYQYLTNSPEILMLAGGVCVYLAGWSLYCMQHRINLTHVSHWLRGYIFYARAICNTGFALDSYQSAFSKAPTRRSFFYLVSEQRENGADFSPFAMLLKTVLNPLRFVRAAFVLAHSLAMLLCLIPRQLLFPGYTEEAHNSTPRTLLFLFLFSPAALVDLTGHLVLKPLEGLIRLTDVLYDNVLPLLCHALLSPVIAAYATYSFVHVTQQFFALFRGAERSNATACLDPEETNEWIPTRVYPRASGGPVKEMTREIGITLETERMTPEIALHRYSPLTTVPPQPNALPEDTLNDKLPPSFTTQPTPQDIV